ncbi:DUF2200 family protein [Novosphingobium sp. PC22D]|uniref:DUF2200 domain-containing protein n=1 Tax=Novosphingobium sp. PC22D TaxID=1962403 RepID=UPI00143BC875|nr:DUF2200 family protein [Novosphingobium sp. PC22D]
MAKHRIFTMSLSGVYPAYVAKAERKGRTKAEVDEIICWLTGHDAASLEAELANKTTLEDFFAQAPAMNPSRAEIKGVVCGVRVEEVEDPTMREIRYLDKLVDELPGARPWTRSCAGKLPGSASPRRPAAFDGPRQSLATPAMASPHPLVRSVKTAPYS